VVLEGRSGLAKLLSLRLIFTAPFTNVLSLRVEANLKRLGITASIKVVNVYWWSKLHYSRTSNNRHSEIYLSMKGTLCDPNIHFS
jgi:hypothetical protein